MNRGRKWRETTDNVNVQVVIIRVASLCCLVTSLIDKRWSSIGAKHQILHNKAERCVIISTSNVQKMSRSVEKRQTDTAFLLVEFSSTSLCDLWWNQIVTRQSVFPRGLKSYLWNLIINEAQQRFVIFHGFEHTQLNRDGLIQSSQWGNNQRFLISRFDLFVLLILIIFKPFDWCLIPETTISMYCRWLQVVKNCHFDHTFPK